MRQYETDEQRLGRNMTRERRKLSSTHGGRNMDLSIKVVRGKSTPEGTPGKATTNADIPFSLDTLELQWANNKTGVSCILPDTYKGSLWYSSDLGQWVLRLEDKHARKNCLWHNMNFAGEAIGEQTQVHGCTGVGKGYGKLKNDEGNMQFAILHSVDTLHALVAHIREQVGDAPFTVTYSWGDGCEPDDMTDAQEAA